MSTSLPSLLRASRKEARGFVSKLGGHRRKWLRRSFIGAAAMHESDFYSAAYTSCSPIRGSSCKLEGRFQSFTHLPISTICGINCELSSVREIIPTLFYLHIRTTIAHPSLLSGLAICNADAIIITGITAMRDSFSSPPYSSSGQLFYPQKWQRRLHAFRVPTWLRDLCLGGKFKLGIK